MGILSKFPSFRVNDARFIEQAVKTNVGAEITYLDQSDQNIDVRANHCTLPNGDLWFCDYGLPISLKLPDRDSLRIQFPRRGSGITRINNHLISVNERHSCIFDGAADTKFEENYKQNVWVLPKQFLRQKMSTLTGQPILSDIVFDYEYDLTTPSALNVITILNNMLQSLETFPLRAANLIVKELEQALAVAFLMSAPHNHRTLLDSPQPSAAPWQVTRAESYMEEHWSDPFDFDDLVAATGVSARSLFRSFQKFRSYTPLEFLKRIRLSHAHELLQAGGRTATVTDVALTCGWSDLSRFSKDFTSAYGEAPSAVLNRGHRMM